jgi:hypothetical protein
MFDDVCASNPLPKSSKADLCRAGEEKAKASLPEPELTFAPSCPDLKRKEHDVLGNH